MRLRNANAISDLASMQLLLFPAFAQDEALVGAVHIDGNHRLLALGMTGEKDRVTFHSCSDSCSLPHLSSLHDNCPSIILCYHAVVDWGLHL